jgi:hypothetical protein
MAKKNPKPPASPGKPQKRHLLGELGHFYRPYTTPKSHFNVAGTLTEHNLLPTEH